MKQRRVAKVVIEATIHTTAEDSLSVLLHSLTAEIEEHCKAVHNVRLKINQAKVDGKPLWVYSGPRGKKLRRVVTSETL